VVAPTKLVVRYHDAFPLLMPHTIIDRSRHREAHYEALRRNVLDGAWFACVSEASRRDLLAVFPAVEPRALTIPNMVSHRYFPEVASPGQILDILGTRANRWVQGRVTELRLDARPAAAPRRHRGHLDYLLMVATVEPRKNHLGLLAAWEQLRASGHPELRLVLVGAMGWDQVPIVDRLLPWVGRGMVHVLDDVPAAELRLLYSHARITVCPSFGEGFGFSGVEAMRCGGTVAASDLPVHREVYGQAAEYFNPYASSDMAGALQRLLGPESAARRTELQLLGTAIAARYLPERILPHWQEFLESLGQHRDAGP
jgi:glycosyltransferase involved in cell wall biosynthesis